MGNDFLMLLRVAFGFFLTGIALAAGAQPSNPYENALKEGFRARTVADQFAAKYPADGRNALSYFKVLSGMGFTCAVREFQEVVAEEGKDLGSFSVRKAPIVDCVRVPSRFTECARFRVSALTDARSVEGMRSYVAGLASARITKAYFVCEPTRDSEGWKSFDAEVKNGRALIVN